MLSACANARRAEVSFVEPKNGAAVASPVKVKMAASRFVVEPAGEVKAGAGHLHIMVDAPCLIAGEVVPKDDAHLHYGKGQLEAELELGPGKHTLCLQAADGAHIALAGDGMTDVIEIEVK
jgi:hypothetical protein